MVQHYSRINEIFWQKLERNELTKPQILVGRFEQFFTEVGVPASLAPAFNDRYQLALGDTIVFRDDSINIVSALRGKIRQYAVTNGTKNVQRRKLHDSGLDALLDGVFISEDLGAEKPDRRFFEEVFAAIGEAESGEALIVEGENLDTATQVDLLDMNGDVFITADATFADGKLTTESISFENFPADGSIRVTTAGGEATYEVVYDNF